MNQSAYFLRVVKIGTDVRSVFLQASGYVNWRNRKSERWGSHKGNHFQSQNIFPLQKMELRSLFLERVADNKADVGIFPDF